MIKEAIENIAKNKKLFISYNISRLRELIRYLSEEKFDLFQTIPFLLHVNMPDYPGYVDTLDSFYGICRFENSGFFKYALDKFVLKPETINKFLSESPLIQGLYLMGSAGTLTQSEKSDFDYWLVVDRQEFSDKGFKLLKEKITAIENWCLDEYGQEVTFFIMDVEKIRENDFSVVDSESSGSAQKTLLKEEFYRTFIMVAGKIPFWAVVPVGISDCDYKKIISGLKKIQVNALNKNKENLSFIACNSVSSGQTDDEYFDTGNFVCIDPEECLGAVLWQVYKARNDPVKSLIKASLIAYYFFNYLQKENLVCNIIKNRFSKSKFGDYLFDPYTIVFEKIVRFYKDLDDLQGLSLIRQCIFLRLMGYPFTSLPDLSSPKGKLLIQLADEWQFDLETLNRLKKFHAWPESEKLVFDNLVFDKLSFIYEMILRSSDDLMQINMKKDDLGILVNRTAAFRQKIEGKIPYSSVFLRKKSNELFFTIKENTLENGSVEWQVFENNLFSKEFLKARLIYKSSKFLKIVGWLVSNQLVNSNCSNVNIDYNKLNNHFTIPDLSFYDIRAFLKGFFPRPDHVFKTFRQVQLSVFFLKNENCHSGNKFFAIDYLLVNSWGEFYFDCLDLSCLESTSQRCYKIVETILYLLKKNSEFKHKHKHKHKHKFEYFICHPADIKYKLIPDVVDGLLAKMINGTGRSEISTIKKVSAMSCVKKRKPFLDLL